MKKNTLIALCVFAFGFNSLFSQEPANMLSNSELNFDVDTSALRPRICYIAMPSMNVEPLKFLKPN